MKYFSRIFLSGIVLMVFSIQLVIAQTPYYDAVALRKLINPATNIWPQSSKAAVAQILSNYCRKDDVPTVFFIGNPFIKDLSATVMIDQSGLNGSQNILGSIAGIGNFNVTGIADGFAKFLVQRTKEELSIAFFVQIKQDFDDTAFVAVQTLFPHTKQQLDAIGDKVYQYSIYLSGLRNAFNADLEDLSITFPYILNIPKYRPFFAKHAWIEPTIETGFILSDQLLANSGSLNHAGNVIDTLNTNADKYFSPAGNDDNTSINGMIKTLGLISSSFRSTDNTRFWVTNKEILQLLSDPITFKIYLGLIYQNAASGKIVFAGKNGSISLTSVLDDIAPDAKKVTALNNYISGFSTQINLFDEDYKNLKINLKQLDSIEISTRSEAIFNDATGIFQTGLSLLENVNNELIENKQKPLILPQSFFDSADNYTKGLQGAISLYFNIKQRKFVLAISSASGLLNTILKDSKDKNLENVIRKFSTYGTFIAQVANAKNSNQVDSIITNTVLPAGSSYIKKHSIFNIALQAYTGIYGGLQRQATDTHAIGTLGIYAPVGLAFSWGGKENKLNPGAFSIFASIIDLGPLVSYRFKNSNDTLANNVSVRLSQIVSPGLHLIWGIPKVPLSLGGGFSYIPLLTSVETNSIKVNKVDNSPFRFQLFLAVDIPLLNFHNKPR